ncbi:isocitrate dehydrogenase [NADP]-like [Castanea sativa]|uniref:isocitrate dehydrogenase [NADP]-like n=1 Tax=Castanea sativa TaxID=21020 RepID=UPI003F6501F6
MAPTSLSPAPTSSPAVNTLARMTLVNLSLTEIPHAMPQPCSKSLCFPFTPGTLFKEPNICKNIPHLERGWTEPMYIKCHAFGDQYRATDTVIPGSRKLKLVFVLDKHDEKKELEVFNFTGAGGVALSMYNTDESIHAFAEASMNTAYQKRWLLYLSTKNTVLKKYDGGKSMKLNGNLNLMLQGYGFGSLGLLTSVLVTMTTITGSIREVVKPA